MSDPQPKNGYRGGNVPLIVEIHDVEDTDSLGRPGGAVMHWNCKELSPTIRAQDHGHPPVVVLKDEKYHDDREKVL